MSDIPSPGSAHNGPNPDIPRPSVTDDARAEAERREDEGLFYTDDARTGFIKGAEWAASRADPHTEAVVAEADLWLNAHRVSETWRTMNRLRDALVRAAGRAETTTEEWPRCKASRDGGCDRCHDEHGRHIHCRAETTTATDEDDFERAWEVIARVRDAHPRVGNDAPTKDIVDALIGAGLLATARTRPTREQIARALDRAGAFCGECGAEPGDFFDSCLECQRWLLNYADAVLTLLESGER